uniref:Tc1-like transposase DDE domain-containing protein n=1 Tax=Oncorhynchus tshawytscha TaxID=74940 RepID=A0AAZ3PU11_ONCTS
MWMENYVDILKQHLKTLVRKLKLGCKWVFQMDNDPKNTSKVVAKWLKINKVKVLEWPSHQLCQEEWAKIHPTYCGKLVEGYSKCLT